MTIRRRHAAKTSNAADDTRPEQPPGFDATVTEQRQYGKRAEDAAASGIDVKDARAASLQLQQCLDDVFFPVVDLADDCNLVRLAARFGLGHGDDSTIRPRSGRVAPSRENLLCDTDVQLPAFPRASLPETMD